jgi:hypothetical protein
MRRRLSDPAPEPIAAKLGLEAGATWRDVMVETTLRAGIANDGPARRLIWEYCEGPARKAICGGDDAAELAGRTVAEMLARLEELKQQALGSGEPLDVEVFDDEPDTRA